MVLRSTTRKQEIWALANNTTVSEVSENLIEYDVDGIHTVTFDKRKLRDWPSWKHVRAWTCTCTHCSAYRGTKNQTCKFIDATHQRIDREGKMIW